MVLLHFSSVSFLGDIIFDWIAILEAIIMSQQQKPNNYDLAAIAQ